MNFCLFGHEVILFCLFSYEGASSAASSRGNSNRKWRHLDSRRWNFRRQIEETRRRLDFGYGWRSSAFGTMGLDLHYVDVNDVRLWLMSWLTICPWWFSVWFEVSPNDKSCVAQWVKLDAGGSSPHLAAHSAVVVRAKEILLFGGFETKVALDHCYKLTLPWNYYSKQNSLLTTATNWRYREIDIWNKSCSRPLLQIDAAAKLMFETKAALDHFYKLMLPWN